MSDQEEDHYIPLEDQRVFGAGIKRKRIAFVPAASTEPTTPATTSSNSSIADKYLSIVGLPKAASAPTSADSSPAPSTPATGLQPANLCSVCGRPLSPTHESTIAHQVCLAHSHPPSHLDRSRAGVRYLQSYGWDPDERVGLGARAEGRRFPIKPVPKHDTVGLHERVDADSALQVKVRKSAAAKKEDRVVRLNAKQVRKRDDAARKKAEKLRSLFYANDDVEKYLGDGG